MIIVVDMVQYVVSFDFNAIKDFATNPLLYNDFEPSKVRRYSCFFPLSWRSSFYSQ